MGYTKQNFKDGQVLTAEHLNNIEQGIVDASEGVITFATATLSTMEWISNSVFGYEQTVTISGITSEISGLWLDCELSTMDKDANTAILEAFTLVAANPVTLGTNVLTLYAENIPAVNIPIVVGWI